jgi:hypothetical protein
MVDVNLIIRAKMLIDGLGGAPILPGTESSMPVQPRMRLRFLPARRYWICPNHVYCRD